MELLAPKKITHGIACTLMALGVLQLLFSLPLLWNPVFGLVMMLIATGHIWIGINLWRTKQWVRLVARDLLFFDALIAIFTAMQVIIIDATVLDVLILCVYWTIIAVLCGSVIYLTFSRTAKTYFVEEGTSAQSIGAIKE